MVITAFTVFACTVFEGVGGESSVPSSALPQFYQSTTTSQATEKPTATSTPKPISFIGNSCDSLKYEKFGMTPEEYNAIFADNKVSDKEKEELYKNYYTPLPMIFKAHATLYGGDLGAIAELLTYKQFMLDEMVRGWVLIGSGAYGFHPEVSDLQPFLDKYYPGWYANSLLSSEKSVLYRYFADGGMARTRRDSAGQPIPVSIQELNPAQLRVYNITSQQAWKMQRDYFVSINEQSHMTEYEALATGKYISVVSAKSVNDFGRQFLLYDCVDSKLKFVGVVLVSGEAKRDDWTGLGSPTNNNFKFNYFPLAKRVEEGIHWGFDFPTTLYTYFGGITNGTRAAIAIDADLIIHGK